MQIWKEIKVGYKCEFPFRVDDSKKFQEKFKPVLIKSLEEFKKITDGISGKRLAGDTETDGLNPSIHKIVGFSFSTNSYNGYYIPVRHQLDNVCENPEDFFKILSEFLKRNKWFFYNWVFDSQMFRNESIDVSSLDVIDVLAYVYNADVNIKKNNLKWAAKWFLGRDSPTYKETVGADDVTFDMLIPEEAYSYASQDTANTYALGLFLHKKLSPACKRLLEIDCNLVRAFANCYSINEVHINSNYMKDLGMSLREKRDLLANKIFKEMGRTPLNAINLKSNDQVANVLLEMGINTGVFSKKTKKMSVDKDALEKVSHPLAKMLIEYSHITKQITTYVDKLSYVKSGRINFKLFNTSTGRISSGSSEKESSDDENNYYLPLNFQNFTKPKPALFRVDYVGDDPSNKDLVLGYKFTELDKPKEEELKGIKTVEGPSSEMNIRRAITVPNMDFENWYFVALDYASEEVLLIGDMSQDPLYMKAFLEKKDVYKTVASGMYNLDYDSITKNLRKRGKTCVLGLNYGGSYKTIMRNGGLDEDEAKDVEQKYRKAVSVMERWKTEMVSKAVRDYFADLTYYEEKNTHLEEVKRKLSSSQQFNFFTRSAYGRIRWLGYYLGSARNELRRFGIRSVVSHRIQGTAADVMRIVLYELYEKIFKKYPNEIKFVGCVHDELDVCVRKDSLHILKEIKEIMEITPPGCTIPLSVGIDIGYSYGDVFPFVWGENNVFTPSYF